MKNTKDLIPKEEVLTTIANMIEDAKYKLERAKAPKVKRQMKATVNFWQSVEHHMTDVFDWKPLRE
ncbi:hypothetical protein [Cyclobacterium marinum]|uniref:Uncharacterized protein n=1 Tax=Cyclobacterium marinum (strain ATCC 25205 / DSM 745 / LMG 13164 / NCIMB 1802) TaxID=880070 RepID=G0IZ88_CYCMS|nr:hypothetical protein [Cyclobacterium marinum]AEL23867.1 hypothetical protein Cycma_0082 [Cyclobacterium marinum DSM 745]